jgi:hypothetical protein
MRWAVVLMVCGCAEYVPCPASEVCRGATAAIQDAGKPPFLIDGSVPEGTWSECVCPSRIYWFRDPNEGSTSAETCDGYKRVWGNGCDGG